MSAPHVALTLPMALGLKGGGTVGGVQIARALRRAGAQVTLLPVQTHLGWTRPRPPAPKELVGEDVERDLQAIGVRVLRLPARRHLLLDGIEVRRAMLALRASESFDAVIGFHTELLYVQRWLTRKGVPHGVVAAGQYHDLLRPSWKALLRDRDQFRMLALRLSVGRVFRDAQVVFAISDYMKRTIVDVLGVDPSRVTVAYWGVDPGFGAARRERPAAVRNLFFYGSSAPRKGVPDLMDALGRLRRRGVESWTLRLVAWDRPKVEALATEHGVRDKVELLEPMGHEALVAALEWAHVAVLPSRYESFGLACAECQTAGLPVVAYDVGGVGEVVRQDETGWLAPLDDVDALAAAIEDSLRDPERTWRMGERGRELALEWFTWDRTAQTMLAALGLRSALTNTSR